MSINPVQLTLTFLFIASAASAQPHAPSEPSRRLPYGDPRDLSKIEGQIVPVGEHNKYYYTHKKNNISISPFAIMFGAFIGEYSRAVSDHIALKGEIWFHPSSRQGLTEFEFGAPLYFKKMFDGFYIQPGLTYRKYGMGNDDSTFGPHLLIGWHWIWDSGFNTNFNFGWVRDLSRSNDDYNKTEPSASWNVGYAF